MTAPSFEWTLTLLPTMSKFGVWCRLHDIDAFNSAGNGRELTPHPTIHGYDYTVGRSNAVDLRGLATCNTSRRARTHGVLLPTT